MRYGIEVKGAKSTYLVHDVDGIVKAFDKESDASYWGSYLATMKLIDGPYRTVEVIGRRDE